MTTGTGSPTTSTPTSRSRTMPAWLFALLPLVLPILWVWGASTTLSGIDETTFPAAVMLFIGTAVPMLLYALWRIVRALEAANPRA